MSDRKPGSEAGQQVKRCRNIRLALAFDGSVYHGWQIQSDQPTVQGLVSDAIAKITCEQVQLSGSGRTDAGTHARELVANFTTHSRIAPAQIVRALNSLLPHDIRVLSARRAPMAFHARRAARSKIYRYQIYRGLIMPPHLYREHFHYPYPLDLEKMAIAAGMFVGERDFAGFAAGSGREVGGKAQGRRPGVQDLNAEFASVTGALSDDRRVNTVRKIYSCSLNRKGRRLVFTVEGSGFLRHMVRNMVGTLLEVGRGRMTLDHFQSLFEKRDRTLAGFTVPARGLILLRVRY